MWKFLWSGQNLVGLSQKRTLTYIRVMWKSYLTQARIRTLTFLRLNLACCKKNSPAGWLAFGIIMWKSNSTRQNLSGLSQNQRLTLFAFECCRLATLLNTSCSTNLNSMRNNWTVQLMNADTCKHNCTVKHIAPTKTELLSSLNANTCKPKHVQTHLGPKF